MVLATNRQNNVTTIDAVDINNIAIDVNAANAAAAAASASAATKFTPVTGAPTVVQQTFTTAGTARTTSRTDVVVWWVGPVQPTNMLTGDQWLNNS